MTSFQITSAKITGNPDAFSWAQVHEFKPEDKEKLDLRGHLFAVIATKGKGASGQDLRPGGGVDSVAAGRELITRLHEEYFGNTKVAAYNALKEAVDKVILEFRDTWGHVEIAAASFLEDVVYSAVGGGAQAALLRDKTFVKILISNEKNSVSASGYPKPGDTFLLGTGLLFEKVEEGIIKSALESGKVEEAAETLTPIVHSGRQLGSVGAVIIKFEKPGFTLDKSILVQKEPPGFYKEDKPAKTSGEFTKLLRTNFINVLDRIIKVLPERKIFVREEAGEMSSRPNKKVAIVVGGILIALLAVSISFGVRQKKVKEGRLSYEERLSQAQHELEEAQALVSLNKERARELFVNARSTVAVLEEEGVVDPLLQELKESIEQKNAEILGEYSHEPESFVDLSLLSDGFLGKDLTASEEGVLVLNKNGDKIISGLIDTKKAQVVAGPDLVKEANYVASFANKSFIITSSGVTEIGENEASEVIKEGWSGDAFIYSFAGNLYVLEKGRSALWRYPVFEGGYGVKQNWLGQGVSPDLSKIISWTIDGAIWLLAQDGEILKFTQGKPDAFSITGVTPPLISPIAIYASDTTKYLYILDPGRKRIVVLEKNGVYSAQYFAEAIGQASDLAVFEDQAKIIFLTGSQLLSIELKHLGE